MYKQEKDKVFSQIYTGYKDKIYRICYGYIYEKDQVEDLFQEIMINIWNSIDRFRGECQLGTWIYKVAINTALLFNRKTKFYGKTNLPGLEPVFNIPDQDPEEYRQKEEKLKHLAKCIANLEKNDRLIISLILEGLSYEEVSEIVGITPNNVGVKVNRIKKKLLTMINETNHE